MKSIRVISFALVALMSLAILVSCNPSGKGPVDTTVADVKLNVSIKVKDFSGEAVYEKSDYVFTGKKAPNVIELIEDYMYIEFDDKDVKCDEVGAIVSIGDVKAGEVLDKKGNPLKDKKGNDIITYWWYTVNGVQGNLAMDEAVIKNGDKIEYVLLKADLDKK